MRSLFDYLTTNLPSGWSAPQLRRLARVQNGGTPTSDVSNWDGDIPFITPPDLRRHLGRTVRETERSLTSEGARSGSTVVDRGVILSNRAPIGYVGRVRGVAAFNQGCKVVQSDVLDERFLMYALLAAGPALEQLGQGTTFMELSSGALLSFRVPAPMDHEQRAIADYLNRETALIDQLIEKQNALVERLRERRAAVTEEAFNCSGPRAALGHYVSALPGFAFASEGFSSDTSDVPLLRGVNIKPGGINWEQAVYWPREQLASVRRYVLSEGDVVLGLDRPFVSGGTRVQRLGARDAPSLLLQRVVKLIPRKMDPDFLTLVLQSRAFREYAEPEFTGVSVPHLSDKQVRDFRCPVPPPEQQRMIAADIMNRTAGIDALIAKTERHIELAKERRSALITAAVTGQIDIGAA